jgi:hypothetical protein
MLITNVTDTHSGYVIRSALPRQQWLHEGSSVLHFTYIGRLVVIYIVLSTLVDMWV